MRFEVDITHGLDFVGLLQILFIALKLIGCIDWPWIYVLLPLVISAVLGAVGLLVFAVIFLLDRR